MANLPSKTYADWLREKGKLVEKCRDLTPQERAALARLKLPLYWFDTLLDLSREILSLDLCNIKSHFLLRCIFCM